MDVAKLKELADRGYLYARRHATLPLTIYKYTPQCVVDQYWTEETLACRGIVLDDQGEVIARPFRKFFNFEEHYGPIPDGPYEVWVKYDGSLITAFNYGGEWILASSGSFDSEMSREALLLWNEYAEAWPEEPDPEYTYLFEVIYPGNRIVVNYGERRELRHLASIHTKGEWEQPPDAKFGWPVAECLMVQSAKDNPLYLKFLEEPNVEGFVLRYLGSGIRLKIKFDEYVRLHRLFTNMNKKDVWLAMSQGKSLNSMLKDVPDEFFKWLTGVMAEYNQQYADILKEATQEFFRLEPYHADRKEFAAKAKKYKHFGLLFNMLDRDDIGLSKNIWKLIKPTQETKTFSEEEQ